MAFVLTHAALTRHTESADLEFIWARDEFWSDFEFDVPDLPGTEMHRYTRLPASRASVATTATTEDGASTVESSLGDPLDVYGRIGTTVPARVELPERVGVCVSVCDDGDDDALPFEHDDYAVCLRTSSGCFRLAWPQRIARRAPPLARQAKTVQIYPPHLAGRWARHALLPPTAPARPSHLRRNLLASFAAC